MLDEFYNDYYVINNTSLLAQRYQTYLGLLYHCAMKLCKLFYFLKLIL